MTPGPLPHSAVLRVTGWATPADRGIRVNGLLIRTPWRPDGEQRVTVTAYPKTDADGFLRHLAAFSRNVRPARIPNGTQVRVVGQLLKLDRGAGLVRVKVCPAVSDQPPFVVTLHATAQILADLDPVTFHVQVTGRLLSPVGILLADTCVPVHAPVPDRWHRWRPRRRARVARPQEAP